MRILATIFALGCLSVGTMAQEKSFDTTPEIHGTLRGKYEYQTEMNAGRFEVRTARVGISGKLLPTVEYKAEIDLCDEGTIKMLDAYTRYIPFQNDLKFTIGQMRVPFTIDAHRSPHQQYFANRSFIAKQVGNVRDVGATIGYKWSEWACPLIVDAGLFNGSGLTNQKNYWTKGINYSAKAQLLLPEGFTFVLSAQKVKPDEVTVMMYDAGLSWKRGRWFAEVEYLLKTYSRDAYHNVSAFDGFLCYTQPLGDGLFKGISFLSRFDYMGNHSNGQQQVNADGTLGALTTDDYQRRRITSGCTFHLSKPFVTDIRLNYEKYFYDKGAKPKVSEQDKIVIEFVTRF